MPLRSLENSEGEPEAGDQPMQTQLHLGVPIQLEEGDARKTPQAANLDM